MRALLDVKTEKGSTGSGGPVFSSGTDSYHCRDETSGPLLSDLGTVLITSYA